MELDITYELLSLMRQRSDRKPISPLGVLRVKVMATMSRYWP